MSKFKARSPPPCFRIKVQALKFNFDRFIKIRILVKFQKKYDLLRHFPFLAALKSALREDPDVILVGELRDQETIRLALTAAETGHLVLATLHTNSATKAINRITDVFAGDEKAMVRNLLSESLQAVISQTLIPKPSGGRVAAYEVMLATSAIRNLIREEKVAQMQSVIQTGAAAGMQTLQQSVQQLYQQQLVSKETVEQQLGRSILTQ